MTKQGVNLDLTSVKFLLNLLVPTRSKTRENSGVLRVFNGKAGLRVKCSSVSGGTCLMKKYLQEDRQKGGKNCVSRGIHTTVETEQFCSSAPGS